VNAVVASEHIIPTPIARKIDLNVSESEMPLSPLSENDSVKQPSIDVMEIEHPSPVGSDPKFYGPVRSDEGSTPDPLLETSTLNKSGGDSCSIPIDEVARHSLDAEPSFATSQALQMTVSSQPTPTQMVIPRTTSVSIQLPLDKESGEELKRPAELSIEALAKSADIMKKKSKTQARIVSRAIRFPVNKSTKFLDSDDIDVLIAGPSSPPQLSLKHAETHATQAASDTPPIITTISAVLKAPLISHSTGPSTPPAPIDGAELAALKESVAGLRRELSQNTIQVAGLRREMDEKFTILGIALESLKEFFTTAMNIQKEAMFARLRTAVANAGQDAMDAEDWKVLEDAANAAEVAIQEAKAKELKAIQEEKMAKARAEKAEVSNKKFEEQALSYKTVYTLLEAQLAKLRRENEELRKQVTAKKPSSDLPQNAEDDNSTQSS
jgi:hypothetical protein